MIMLTKISKMIFSRENGNLGSLGFLKKLKTQKR